MIDHNEEKEPLSETSDEEEVLEINDVFRNKEKEKNRVKLMHIRKSLNS